MPKMLLGAPIEADSRRLMDDAAARLMKAGFATEVIDDVPSARLSARRGACRLLLWNGDRGKYVGSAFVAQARGLGPLRFGSAGRWSAEPPGLASELTRYAIDRAAAIGMVLSRPAALAMAAGSACPAGVTRLLGGLRTWPDLRLRAALHDEE